MRARRGVQPRVRGGTRGLARDFAKGRRQCKRVLVLVQARNAAPAYARGGGVTWEEAREGRRETGGVGVSETCDEKQQENHLFLSLMVAPPSSRLWFRPHHPSFFAVPRACLERERRTGRPRWPSWAARRPGLPQAQRPVRVSRATRRCRARPRCPPSLWALLPGRDGLPGRPASRGGATEGHILPAPTRNMSTSSTRRARLLS